MTIEVTARPVRGYSGTIHFGVETDADIRVSRVSANSYDDDRSFVTVKFKEYGLDFVFDRDDVEEAWKEQPNVELVKAQAINTICRRMTPKVFNDILTKIRWAKTQARDEGREEIRSAFCKLLGMGI